MSQFSKKLALVCALGTLSLSLTGCHGSKGLPEFTVPEEFDTSRNYEITFWAKNDTNKTQTEIYKKAIADFEALYPNITVNLNLYTDYGKIYNDVITSGCILKLTFAGEFAADIAPEGVFIYDDIAVMHGR